MKNRMQELVEAAECLERVLVDLDTTESMCPTCGRKKAENWTDAKTFRALSAAKKRIDQSIIELMDEDDSYVGRMEA